MGSVKRGWARLLSVFRQRDLDHELDEELSSHIDLATADYIQRGMGADEARRLARVKLGAREASKDAHRDSRGLPWAEGIGQDVRHAFRALRKSPGFTLAAVATLALAIGVNATVFTITNAVLFKGFRLVDRNDRLVYISDGGCCVPYADFEDYRAQSKSFTAMAVVHGIGAVLSDGSGFAERLETNENSAEVFRLAGVKPLLGRDFSAADEVPGAPAVVILNYNLWARRYAKDPNIIDRTFRLNGAVTSVIGVMPEGFSFPQRVDLWVPLVRTPQVLRRDNTGTWFAFGRLRDGVSFESARTEIESIAARLRVAYPRDNQDFQPKVQHFHEFFIGSNAALIYGSMWGAVGFVLLIACANLANLQLSRALTRSREIAVRVALGAGRWRVIRQLLIESVMLSSIGGFFGWWIAKWGVGTYDLAMTHRASWLIVDYRMESGVLIYLIAISLGTGVLFGLAPALQLLRLDTNSSLKEGSRGSTGAGRTKRLSSLLVAGEMALAMMLLAGAGVMIRSFLKVYTADIGVNTANVLAVRVSLPQDQYANPASWLAFFDRLQARLASVPGVQSVAMADGLPAGQVAGLPYEVAGAPPADEARRPRVFGLRISPGYFRTLGASLVAGRDFNDADQLDSTPVAIVNQRLANKLWPGEDPIGRRLRFFDGSRPQPWLTVVGVASNIVQNDLTHQQFHPLLYWPYRQQPEVGGWVLAKTAVPPESLVAAFRNTVLELARDVPLTGPFALDQRREVLFDSGFYGIIFLIFAGVALLLAAVGLYTVVAHSVDQRTQEIGIRVAVGAGAGDVLHLVFKQGMLPLAGGLSVGLIASFAVNRLLQSELVSVSPTDPVALTAAAGVLSLAALLGCMIPARRAMRVDPVVALRHD